MCHHQTGGTKRKRISLNFEFQNSVFSMCVRMDSIQLPEWVVTPKHVRASCYPYYVT